MRLFLSGGNCLHGVPLAILVSLPVVRYIAAMLYNRFADYRFARLEHCQISVNAQET